MAGFTQCPVLPSVFGGSGTLSLNANGDTLVIGTVPNPLSEAPLSYQAVYLY